MRKRLCIMRASLFVALLLVAASPLFAAPTKSPFLWRTPLEFPEHKPEIPGPEGLQPSGEIQRIDRAADGGAYILGSVTKYFPGHIGERAPFVVKVDAAGNIIWGRTYNLQPLETPYIIGGSTLSPDSLTGVRLAEKGDGSAVLLATGLSGQTLVLIALDAAGDETGRREIKAAPGHNGGGRAWVSDVLFPPDGTLVMVGGTSSADQLTKESYAAKLDLAGNLLWAVNLGEGQSQEGTVLDAGGVAIWSLLPQLPGVIIDGSMNYVYKVAVIDAAGSIVRSEQTLAPSKEQIVPAPDGGYFQFSGNTSFDEALGIPAGFTHHITMSHTSPTGVVDWSKAYAFPGQWNWYNKLENSPDGGVLLSGGGQCAGNTGFEFRAIRVAPHGSASWAGGFADCNPGTSGPFDVQWATGGGFLLTTKLTDEFIGLLPAKPQSGALTVKIDVQPASEANTVNLTRDTLLPVAIWSRPDFDARDIDLATVTVAGAPVLQKKSGYAASSHDLNRDGYADLIVSIPVNRLSISPGLNHIILQGALKNGVTISGEDTLTVR